MVSGKSVYVSNDLNVSFSKCRYKENEDVFLLISMLVMIAALQWRHKAAFKIYGINDF